MNVYPEWNNIYDAVVSVETIDGLDSALKAEGFALTDYHYSMIRWIGKVNGRVVKFRAYPTGHDGFTVQSYVESRIGVFDKLFENLHVKQ